MATAMVEVGLIGVRLEAWTYGSGFPKSLNIGKAIDRAAGAEREVVGTKRGVGGENMNDIVHGRSIRTHEDEGGKGVGAYGTGAKQVAIDVPITAPATDAAKRFESWGTALKPSWEPVVGWSEAPMKVVHVLRKPLSEKTVAANTVKHGTGGVNINASRIGNEVRESAQKDFSAVWGNKWGSGAPLPTTGTKIVSGRWPANLILQHLDGCRRTGTRAVKAVWACASGCPVRALDEQSGVSTSAGGKHSGGKGTRNTVGGFGHDRTPINRPTDIGGASRFFKQVGGHG